LSPGMYVFSFCWFLSFIHGSFSRCLFPLSFGKGCKGTIKQKFLYKTSGFDVSCIVNEDKFQRSDRRLRHVPKKLVAAIHKIAK